MFMFFIILGEFQPIFFLPPSLFSCRDFHSVYVSYPQAPEALLTFLLFFPAPQTQYFSCPIFTFVGSFFYMLKPAFNAFNEFSFQLHIFLNSFYYFLIFSFCLFSWFPLLYAHAFLYLFEHTEMIFI